MIHADQSIKAERVVEIVTGAAKGRGTPGEIRVDNGSEFISKALDLWADQRQVTLDVSRPERLQDNGHLESCNGSFRDECFNTHWVLSLDDAAETIAKWRVDSNDIRPHSALGNLAPRAFSAQFAPTSHPPQTPFLFGPVLPEHLNTFLSPFLPMTMTGPTAVFFLIWLDSIAWQNGSRAVVKMA